jgi:hypothetical protein
MRINTSNHTNLQSCVHFQISPFSFCLHGDITVCKVEDHSIYSAFYLIPWHFLYHYPVFRTFLGVVVKGVGQCWGLKHWALISILAKCYTTELHLQPFSTIFHSWRVIYLQHVLQLLSHFLVYFIFIFVLIIFFDVRDKDAMNICLHIVFSLSVE